MFIQLNCFLIWTRRDWVLDGEFVFFFSVNVGKNYNPFNGRVKWYNLNHVSKSPPFCLFPLLEVYSPIFTPQFQFWKLPLSNSLFCAYLFFFSLLITQSTWSTTRSSILTFIILPLYLRTSTFFPRFAGYISFLPLLVFFFSHNATAKNHRFLLPQP